MKLQPSIPHGTPPEIELLLLLLRADDAARAGRLVASGPDWEGVLRFAHRHRLVPMLHHRLQAAGTPDLPDSFREAVCRQAEANARNNLLLSGELVGALALLGRNGVKALPLKGPFLAQELYGSLSMRSYSDIDLLVRAADASRSIDLLRGIGYQPRPELTAAAEAAYLRYEYDRSMENTANGAHLELHWRLLERTIAFPLKEEELWALLRDGAFAGAPAMVMPDHLQLLFLAVHGAKHAWSILGWTLDVARLAGREGMEWDRLRALARDGGCRRLLHAALVLAGRLWGVELPETFAAEVMADASAADIAEGILERSVVRAQEAISSREEARCYLSMRERLRDRMRFRWLWLVTPNLADRRALRFPAWLSFLYIPARPLRLAWRAFARRGASSP
ncbi:MAG TPA: nucleotidyltransferase family protein [Candidatus Kapabacteria bacterium]|nr:nucleotidyltransferase family protein [Candidatus Kapabacteria bacterium]